MDGSFHILVLEQPGANTELLTKALAAEGPAFRLYHTATESQFQRRLIALAPDLVLAGHLPPHTDAIAALAAVRLQSSRTPFIFIAAAQHEETAREAVRQGATDYVLRERIETLASAVRRALRHEEESPAPTPPAPAPAPALPEPLHYSQVEHPLGPVEARIREQARLLDLAPDAIYASNLDGTIVYWNESAAFLYGWTAPEALGKSAGTMLQQDPAKTAGFKRMLLATERWSDELAQVAKNGRKVLVESRQTLVRDRLGNPKSILAINTDITERKKTEAQLLRSQRLESVGTLASVMARDLGNVLTPIMLSCQLLDAYAVRPEEQQLLEVISRSARRGSELINQILSFCRGTEGRRVELQIKPLLLEIAQLIQETFPKNIRLETKLGPDLWPVLADPTQLHQVILNLCVNARDAMPNGGLLTIEAQNIMPDGSPAPIGVGTGTNPQLMLVVADTGTGIAPEIREKIFDPFFSTKEPGKGSGLGLSTSLGIVRSHGVVIHVHSEPGAGTRFKVCLPALVVPSDVLAKADEARLPHGNGELILVVDDEAAVRAMTSQTLQLYGYTVLTASDGAQAVELHRRRAREVAVVLMDMMMPVMSGPDAIQTMSRENPALKVIAVSGLSAEAQMSKIPGNSVKGFLLKPYTVATLLNTIREALEP